MLNLFVLLWFAVFVKSFDAQAIHEYDNIYKQDLPPFILHTGVTVPGTKWCGPSNTAADYNDLGAEIETDKCCRDHDHCPNIMQPNESIHDLPPNTGLWSMLQCTCEQQFTSCLHAVNNSFADMIGFLYYSASRICFNEGYPNTECKEYDNMLLFPKRCIHYDVDKSKPVIWQFYDMPFYRTECPMRVAKHLMYIANATEGNPNTIPSDSNFLNVQTLYSYKHVFH